MGSSYRSVSAETTRAMNFHPFQESSATTHSQAGSPQPLVDMEEDGRVKDRDPVAGKGSVCRLKTRLLQNG